MQSVPEDGELDVSARAVLAAGLLGALIGAGSQGLEYLPAGPAAALLAAAFGGLVGFGAGVIGAVIVLGM